MQVIVSGEARAGQTGVWAFTRAILIASVLLVGASLLAYAMFGTGLLDAFTPSGRATSTQLAIGALAWAFALTAPVAFGIVGLARLGSAIERIPDRRRRRSPAYRVRNAIGADHALATGVPLPDGSRLVPEIVVGPFGAAVIEELPPAAAVLTRGSRSWEVRMADGSIHLIENPLERASRDADRVRVWFCGDDADHVVRVYAAVVGTDSHVARTTGCALITPDQIGVWLASLPAQRSFDADRRERVIGMLRGVV